MTIRFQMRTRSIRQFIDYYKPIFHSLSILLISSLFFSLAIKGIRIQNLDLLEVDKHLGEVISTGETLGTGKRKAMVFFVTLKGLPQMLGVYRMSRNYNDLLEEVKEGDLLTVYYNRGSSNQINIDVIQIEKNGRIILPKSEFEKKYFNLIPLGLIAGLLFVALAFYNYKKYFINRNRAEK